VAVVDLAFAGGDGAAAFDKVTLPLIKGLGDRLRAWVDHHDHELHGEYQSDPRFVLATKAQHGACPEMITEELVQRLGPVDTVLCHTDFDGLVSAAKWMRAGVEPYAGCDDDARAVDTRIGQPSATGERFDRALRARPRDVRLYAIVVEHLFGGLKDASLWAPIDEAAAELRLIEHETRLAAHRYQVFSPGVAYVDLRQVSTKPVDKTLLLLLGQERAQVSVVVDAHNITVAAAFGSGQDFLKLFGLKGGMPTRVSVAHTRLRAVLTALGVSGSDRLLLE
jgi:hypothetical protein